MTVGISAVCEADSDDPKVVVAADRLVTSGIAARREYEHTSSKMLSLMEGEDDQQVCAVGIGAGSVSLSDEVFYKINRMINSTKPQSGRTLATYGVQALQEVVQETLERQVLSSHNLTLDAFNQTQGQMNPQIVQAIYQDLEEAKTEIHNNVNILLAAVDGSGAHLYNIVESDMARHDSIGYLTVGSGREPANSSFMRSRYNDNCSVDDALLAVTEAKAQAEEAQGVGRNMDMAILEEDGRNDLEDGQIDELRNLHEEIVKEQAEAKESVLEENSYTFEQ